MASSKGKKHGTGTKRPILNFFYLNGDLHKKLEINRGKDRLVAWNFAKHKRAVYNYTDTLRFMDPAFTTKQVCAMLNRGRVSIENAIKDGMIERPQFAYTLDERRRITKYMWHEDNILMALDYFASIPQGRPRKDGRITAASNLPTPREVRAMVRHGGKPAEGEQFTPTWRAR